MKIEFTIEENKRDSNPDYKYEVWIGDYDLDIQAASGKTPHDAIINYCSEYDIDYEQD